MKRYNKITKFLLIVIVNLLTLITLKAQYIYIDYHDPEVIILTPYRMRSYEFSYKREYTHRICVEDSTTYSFISSHIDSLVYAKESDELELPQGSQKIVVFKPNTKEYDMIFSDGFTMEKNGRCVMFDEELQRVINDIIKRDIAKRKKKTK